MRSLGYGALVAFLTFASTAMATAPAGSPPGSWTLLSTWTIGPNVDNVAIPIGVGRGEFSKLFLAVSNNPLTINDVKVTYSDGKEETVSVKTKVDKGGVSKVLELKGTVKTISTVTVTNDKVVGSAVSGVSLFGS